MDIKTHKGAVGAAVVSLWLAACGGGGSGGTQPPAPPPVTVTPSVAKASFVAGYPVDIALAGTLSSDVRGGVWIQVTPDPAVFEKPSLSRISVVTEGVTLHPLASLPAGHYSGVIVVNICSDSACHNSLPGAPFNVPYDIDAISQDGQVATFNLSPLAPLAGAGDWGTFQGNAAHTGYVPVTLDASRFSRRWVWQAPSYAGVQWTPSAITTGGSLFFVASGPMYDGHPDRHELIAWRESDGGKAWSHGFGDLAYANTNPPSFADGKVFIAAGSGESTAMFAFDAATGAQVFKSAMMSQYSSYYAPTILDGLVYSTSGEYDGLAAFDAVSGVQAFFNPSVDNHDWTPAVDTTRAYVYTSAGLAAYDRRTGDKLLTIVDPGSRLPAGIFEGGAPVLGDAHTVFAGDLDQRTDNWFSAFDTSTNSMRWTMSGAFSGNPAYADATLFASNNKPFALEAHRESDGVVAWTWTPSAGDTQFVSDVLVTRNLVFVSTDQATYAVDRATHASVWSIPASGTLSMSSNGTLYIKGAKVITAVNLH